MAFPIKVCVVCSEEFELRPDKPGYANRCPACSVEDTTDSADQRSVGADERMADAEMNAIRRRTIRDMLYSKDS